MKTNVATHRTRGIGKFSSRPRRRSATKPRWQTAVFSTIHLFTCVAVVGQPLAAKADVIYQAFNLSFQEVKAKIPELRDQGYQYIQISPPQKSNPAEQWWARYQPIDHTVIDSPLGNESDLKDLIDAAHQQGSKIIIDVVLNHMANYEPFVSNLRFPKFSPRDFNPRNCITDWRNRWQVTRGWLGCDLPDLNTQSPYVRYRARNYLKKLLGLGADGFRFDAAKHIELESFQSILQVVPPDKYMYGEVIGSSLEESYTYTSLFDVTDFHLLSTLKAAFGYGGDLRRLSDPQSFGGALPGPSAITFAQNHDTAAGRDLHETFGFADQQDAMLANAYVLARQEGFPVVYSEDANNAITQAGVRFHKDMMGQSQHFRDGNEIAMGADNPNILFIERGRQGLVIINKAGEAFEAEVAKMPGLDHGCYQELQYEFTMVVGQGQDDQTLVTQWKTSQQGGIQIGPRDALFFIKTDAQRCEV
ncbi:MAG: alpha-amylase [Cyanothece sp. SIO1E1]|nr:alpha-amylase [Cyanothece sp. SIO1E1]